MSGPRRRRPDRVVIVVAVLAAVWAMVDLMALMFLRGDRVMVGVDGPFAADQLQYLTWIRESGDHILVHNLYDGSIEPGWFVHPMFLVSGGLWRAGVPLVLSFQLWKPVVVGVLVLSYDTLVREIVGEHALRRFSALVLGLFAASPLIATSSWFGHGDPNDDLLMPQAGSMSWGYLPTAAAPRAIGDALRSFRPSDQSGSRRRPRLPSAVVAEGGGRRFPGIVAASLGGHGWIARSCRSLDLGTSRNTLDQLPQGCVRSPRRNGSPADLLRLARQARSIMECF